MTANSALTLAQIPKSAIGARTTAAVMTDEDLSAADFATFGTLKAFVAGVADPDAAPDGSTNS